VTWSITSGRRRLRKIAVFVETGNELLYKVRAERDNTKAGDLSTEVSNWATEVYTWLDGNLPEFAPYFLNDAGHGVQFSISGREAQLDGAAAPPSWRNQPEGRLAHTDAR
jgi:hypothetical protein